MHPNKHIRAAIKYAVSMGWRVKQPASHAYCRLLCSHGHRLCKFSVWSTPRNPEDHARDIVRRVNQCPGGLPDDA
ncbi:hypothetical protein Pla175_45590 [Pirellulimonas nuda]|uniref:YcfA-like protein n=1 Tax=Pirellulimonas nuda TaxID=2528009 RepID=A0A518DI35_9BACT|nr:hypothetical protein Pla175_45590 [Pirellulimonas nuda]